MVWLERVTEREGQYYYIVTTDSRYYYSRYHRLSGIFPGPKEGKVPVGPTGSGPFEKGREDWTNQERVESHS